MRKLFQKIISTFCAAAVAFSAADALAEFSPRYAAMQQRDDMTITVTGSLDSLSKLSDGSLEKVNGWLQKMEITLRGKGGGAVSGFSVRQDGKELLSVSLLQQDDGTTAVFMPSGSAYRTGDSQPNALALLTGEETHLYDPLQVPRFYLSLARQLFPVLSRKTAPKASRSSTSIKNASPAASFETYAFKAEEMNAAWPDILNAVLPVLKEAMQDQPGRYAQWADALSKLQFSGECRFKRFMTKEQEDMGLQFTGSAALGEDVRKVTLFGGYTEGKGGYLSFSAPAVKGRNTLKYTLSGKLTESRSGVRTLAVETAYSRTLDGVSESAGVNVSLKNTIKDENETWSGKITCTETKNKVKTAWTLVPDMTFTEEGLKGAVRITRKTGGKTDLKAGLQVLITDSAALTEDEPENVQDLRELDAARAKTAVQGELANLTGLVARALATLTEADRALLTHEMRTDEWMTADTVPAEETETSEEPDGQETPETTPDPQPEDEEPKPEGEWSDEDLTDGDGWFTDDDADSDGWFTDDDSDGDWLEEEETETPEQEEEPDPTPVPLPTPSPKPVEENLFDDDWYGEDWFTDN